MKVLIRIRPENASEKDDPGAAPCLQSSGPATVILTDPLRQDPYVRTFDAVLTPDAQQNDVFKAAGEAVVSNCLAGFNSSLFAYGQTGAGKTYTMVGDALRVDDGSLAPKAGLILRVFEELFQRIEEAEQAHTSGGLRFSVKCSFLECYNEEISDLLAPSAAGPGLCVRDGDATRGIFVQGLTEESVLNADDVLALIQRGALQQHQAATKMNERSSRSHSVFTATLEARERREDTGLTSVRSAKLNLIDLAGSERVGKSGATGEQLTEAKSINKSLACLGRVIQALVDRQKNPRVHIPYRDSRLTFLLQESLGGNSKTWFIACVTPSSDSAQETYSTLVFAAGAKKIKNKAVINMDTVGDMRALQAENARLVRLVSELQTRETDDGTVTELRQRLEATQELFDQNCSAITALQAEYAISKRDLKEAKEASHRWEEDAAQLRTDNRSLGAETARLQEEIDRLHKELDDKAAVCRNNDAERRELALDKDRLESELCRCRKEVMEKETSLTKASRDLEETRNGIKLAIAEVEDAKAEIRRLDRLAADETARAHRLQAELDTLYAVAQQQRAEVQSAKSQLSKETVAMAKYRRMVGEIGKLIDWAQTGANVSPQLALNLSSPMPPSEGQIATPGTAAALRLARGRASFGGGPQPLLDTTTNTAAPPPPPGPNSPSKKDPVLPTDENAHQITTRRSRRAATDAKENR